MSRALCPPIMPVSLATSNKVPSLRGTKKRRIRRKTKRIKTTKRIGRLTKKKLNNRPSYPNCIMLRI